MTAYTFGSTSGDWGTLTNWTPNGVPNSSSDDVYIVNAGVYTATIATAESFTVDSVTLDATGATLAINGALALSGPTDALYVESGTLQLGGTLTGGAVDLSGGTFTLTANSTYAGTFAQTGGVVKLNTRTLTLSGPASFSYTSPAYGTAIDGPGSLITSGTTNVNDPGNTYNYVLSLGGGAVWTNNGTVNDGGVIAAGNSSGASAQIVNSATGVFDLTSDDGDIIDNNVSGSIGNSTFTNAGTLAKTSGTGISHIWSTITDTGTINVGTGTLEIDTGGTFNGKLAGNGTLAFAGGTSTMLANTSLIIQNILIDGGAVKLPGDVGSYGGVITLAYGSLTLGANLKLLGSFYEGYPSYSPIAPTLNLGGYTLTLAGNSFFGVSQYDYYAAVINGGGTLATTGVTTVADTGTNDAGVIVGGGMTWTNSGTLFVAGTIDVGDAAGLNATFNNSGTFDFTTDDGSIANSNVSGNFGSATFSNTGLLEKTGGLNTSHIYANVTDSTAGAIKVATGTLEFDGGGTFSGPISGNGVVDFAAGLVTLQSSSTLTASHLVFSGATVSLATSFTSYAGTFEEEGGSLKLGANLALTGYFEQTLGTLSLNGKTLTASGTVQLGDGPNPYVSLPGGIIDGSGAFKTTGQVSILNSVSAPYTITAQELGLGGGLTWTNSGTVSDAGLIGVGDSTGPNIAIVNSGSFDLTTDDGEIVNDSYSVNGVTQTGYSTFANSGTLAKTGGVGVSHVWSLMTDTGTIAVTSGTLEFDDGGTFSGAFTGAGTLAFGGGTSTLTATTLTVSTLLLDGGALTLRPPSTAYTGTIENTSGILTLNGTVTDSGRFYDTGGSVQLAGWTLVLSGVAEFGEPTSAYYSSNYYSSDATIDGTGSLITYNVQIYDPNWGGNYATKVQVVLGGGATWTNKGVVADAGRIATGDASGVSASIVNIAGATFNFTSDDGDIVDNTFTQSGQQTVGYSTFTNNGTIEKSDGFGVSAIWSSVTDSGTITVQTGTIEFDGGGSFTGAINGAGTVAFGAGQVVLNSGNLLTVGGLLFDGASVALPSNFAAYAGNFSETAGWVTLNANLALSGPFSQTGGVTELDGANLTLTGAAIFGAGIYNGSAATFDGPGDLFTSAAVTLFNPAYYPNGAGGSTAQLVLGGGAQWTNSGVVNDAGWIYAGDASGLDAAIVNTATGTFDLVGNEGNVANANVSGQVGSSTFDNAGLLEKTGGDGANAIASTMTDTGSTVIQIGTLDFTGGGSFTGSISGAGTVDFGGSTAVLGSGASLTVGAVLIDAGELEVATSLTYAGVLNETGGDLNIDASSVLNLSNAAYFAAGTVDGGGTIEVSGQMTLAGVSLLNSAETVDATGSIVGFGTIGPAVTDNGLIEASGGHLILGGAATGTGALQINPNAELELQGASALAVNFNGPGGELWLDSPASYTGKLGGLVAGDTLALGSTDLTAATFNTAGILLTLSGGLTETIGVTGSTSALNLTLTHDTSGNSYLAIGNA